MPRKNKKNNQSGLKGRFELVNHNAATIAIANYSHATRDETWALTQHLATWLSEQKPNSANLYFDLRNIYYEAKHVNHWKKSLGRNDAIIRKSCFVNASPLMFIVVKAMRAYSVCFGIPMKKNRGVFFDSKDAAMQWLSEP